jgi:hypothetical protein
MQLTYPEAAGRTFFDYHQKRDDDDSFISNDRDLRRFDIRITLGERNNRGSRKLDMTQNAARFIEHLSKRHLHML